MNTYQTKKLGELVDEGIVQLTRGKVISKKDIVAHPGNYPIYSSAKENDGMFGRYGEFLFDEPLITWSVDGGGRLFYRPKHRFSVTNVGGILRILKPELLDYRYLFYVLSLKHSEIRFDWVRKAHPSIIRELYKGIPLPSLKQQRQIVKKLDDVFDGVAKAKKNAEKNLQNSKELFESYLQSVFEKPGKGWEKMKLGDKELLGIIDGDRGKNYPKKSDFLSDGYCLFMNTKNVRPDGFDFATTMFVTEKKDKALGNGKLQRNDVVMTTRGTIGNLGLYSDDVKYEDIRINSGMLIFRPNTKRISPYYLFEILRSGIMKTQIKKHVSGTAQPQLPIKTLVNFSIPVPTSLTEQRGIVKKLHSLLVETKKLGKMYEQKLADLDELKKSVLSKAFHAEL